MRNFTATVKERDVGEPCFVVLEVDGEPSARHVVLDLPEGSGFKDAQEVAQLLNRAVVKVGIGLD